MVMVDLKVAERWPWWPDVGLLDKNMLGQNHVRALFQCYLSLYLISYLMHIVNNKTISNIVKR